MIKKSILYVLQQTGRRPLSPEAITRSVNGYLDAPATVERVRATLGELEAQGFVQRRASVLDPADLVWLATKAGMEVSTL